MENNENKLKLTPNLSNMISRVKTECLHFGYDYVPFYSLCWGIFSEGGEIGHIKTLTEEGIDCEYVAMFFEALFQEERPLPAKEGDSKNPEKVNGLDEKSKFTMKLTIEASKDDSFSFGCIGLDHLLLGILRADPDLICKIFKETSPLFSKEVDEIIEKLEKNIKEPYSKVDYVRLSGDGSIEPIEDSEIDEEYYGEEEMNKGLGKGSLLKEFSRDLSKLAREGEIAEIFDRESEIEALGQTILRKNKPNPILLGDAGVGKTAVVEGFAKQTCDPSNIFYGYEVYELDISKVVAGTKYRGEFEERLSNIIKEVEGKSNVIIFIDEIHMLVGAGSVEGAIDGGNMLKPALARGSIKLIGATTFEEYHKSIEKDPALQRRFETIYIKQPTTDQTKSILNKAKKKYESHHKVKFSKSVIDYVVDLCEDYIFDKNFPDKAFDIIDQAGAFVSKKSFESPDELAKIIREIEDVDLEVSEGGFEGREEEFYKERNRLSVEYSSAKKSYKSKIKNKKDIVVTRGDIEEVISQKSKIDIETVKNSNEGLINNAEKTIKREIFGQNQIIERICDTIRVANFGIRDLKKPMSSFLFTGSTGVGKTLMAKKIAEYMYGSAKRLVRFDMSEYNSQTSIKKLIGADPGYVGFESGGSLIEAVKKVPHGVVLFDELEKADSSIKNLCLQILDEGCVTDNSGKKVRFSNIVFIATTNATGKSKSENGSIGFGDRESKEKDVRENLQRLERFFAPELMSRFEIIHFEDLDDKSRKKIAEHEVKKYIKGVSKKKGITIKYDNKLIDFLSEPDKIQSGARAILLRANKEFQSKFVKHALKNKEVKEFHATVSRGKVIFNNKKND